MAACSSSGRGLLTPPSQSGEDKAGKGGEIAHCSLRHWRGGCGVGHGGVCLVTWLVSDMDIKIVAFQGG
jgi:hypothetical protein